MTLLPQLDTDAVARWVDPTSFQRASSYVEEAIYNTQRDGNLLTALCQGTLLNPYVVQARLGNEGVQSAACTCPVGDDGHCKHVAALLLTWIEAPDIFRDASQPDTSGTCSQVEPVDPSAIRRQVRQIRKRQGLAAWNDSNSAVQQLQALVRQADTYAADEEWPTAILIYETLARELLTHYDDFSDNTGDLLALVEDCVREIGEALNVVDNVIGREEILSILLDLYLWDINHGPFGVGHDVPSLIAQYASPTEKQQVANWVRAALPQDTRFEGSKREAMGAFLLALQEETVNDEEFLQICQETGRHSDGVTRLLARGRVAEAHEVARQVQGVPVVPLLDIFVAQGHAEAAESIVREQLAHSDNLHLLKWLKQRAEQQGDWSEALAVIQKLFWHRPTLPTYKEVKRLDQQLDQWNAVCPLILARLTKQKEFHLLTQIHIAEKEPAAALASLRQLQSATRHSQRIGDLSISVARLAERSHPREAIALYMERINKLVAARSRHNYRSAAANLLRVRKLYKQLGETAEWNTLISDLREKNHTLRVLDEELTRVGL